jgi:acyl carrier protein phosphodiesterase
VNHLAHFHLSDGDNGLIIGALLGDHVKGLLKGHYPASWEAGIRLHRSIDAFTDRHREIRQAQHLFEPEYRRYSGIMLDVLFDHFLNRHWEKFHHRPLTEFSQQVYQIITSHPLPESAYQQAANFERYDVLLSYQHWQTIEIVLERIGQRLKRKNPLAQSAEQLQKHYPALEQLFLSFYPQLQAHAQEQRNLFDQE